MLDRLHSGVTDAKEPVAREQSSDLDAVQLHVGHSCPRAERVCRVNSKGTFFCRVLAPGAEPIGFRRLLVAAEGDLAVFETEQPAIGNGDALGVVRQIANHVLWSG